MGCWLASSLIDERRARAVATRRPEGAGAEHRREVRRLLGTHLRHTFVASRLSRSPAVVDAGIRAGARDQRVFNAFVELGLGDGLLTSRLLRKTLGQLVLRRK